VNPISEASSIDTSVRPPPVVMTLLEWAR
jgi:hypothetical protein